MENDGCRNALGSGVVKGWDGDFDVALYRICTDDRKAVECTGDEEGIFGTQDDEMVHCGEPICTLRRTVDGPYFDLQRLTLGCRGRC